MAMVGNSPANQTTNRSWTVPASSPSLEADEPVTHANHIQTNLHGVIGEHRRSSRSSSVSSGGSSGNTTDSNDVTRQGAISRLPSVSQADSNGGLDGTTQQHPQNMAELQGQAHSHLSTPNGLSTEFVSQMNPMPPTASDGSDPLSLSFALNARAIGTSSQNTPFPTITSASRHGRPITGSALGPFSGSQTSPNESEVNGLLNDGSLAAGYASLQVDFDNHDMFSMASMGNALMTHPSAGQIGQIGTSFSSQKSFASNGSPFSYGNAQQMFNPTIGGNQFQPMSSNSFQNQKEPANAVAPPNGAFFAGQQQQNSFANAGAQQQNYFSGMSNNGRQTNGFYNNAVTPPAAPVYNSQDYSMPPPSQPWQGFNQNQNGPSNDMEAVLCQGCQKVYKWPHILDCLHAFCFPCMVKRVDVPSQSISCLNCCHVTSIPEGPCSLRLDYQMCGLMVKMKVSPFTCTLCTREQDAAFCCNSCSAYLCHDCCDRHKLMLHFQGHQIKPITKLTMHNGEYRPMCLKHPSEPEDKYCVACELMICEECVTEHTHPNMPAGSNYDLQEAFNIIAPRLQNWNEDAFIKNADMKEMVRRFDELNHVIDGRKRSSKRLIDEYTDYIKNVVDQCRSSAMEHVEQAHAQMDVKLQTLIKSYTDLSHCMDGMSKFNIRTLNSGNVPSVMKNLSVMESTYKRLIGMYCESLKCPEGITIDFKFSPNYPNTSEFLHDNFHNIFYKINDNDYKVIPNTQFPRPDTRSRNLMEYGGASENPDCNYQRWSAATESMAISTWNNSSEKDKKNGTFIPNINRCRTRTSYIHVFGEYGRGDYAFTEPSGQAYLQDGSYVICDTNNHRIVYYNANHEFVRSIGQPPNLPPLAEEQDQRTNGLRNKGFTRQEGYLYFPNRVAICPITQNIVATERPPSHDIQIFTVEGEFKRCFGGNILQHPRGVTVDEHGTIIVVECKVMKLVMFDQDGNFIVSHSLTKDLEFPNDVAAKSERIYISDNRGHCVQVFSYEAEFIMKIGFESVTYFPIGVSINFMNQLVVTDNHNTFNITVFDLNGKVMHIFESITKHAQCHNVAVHPTNLELMLTTKDCNVYFFNYDPNAQHPPPSSTVPRSIGHQFNRRGRGNSNGNGNNSSTYFQ